MRHHVHVSVGVANSFVWAAVFIWRGDAADGAMSGLGSLMIST